MKLPYIILSLVFLLTAIYGLERFIAGRRNVKVAVKVSDKRDDKRIQAKAKRVEGGKMLPEVGSDIQLLLSNNFFDLSRSAGSGNPTNITAELKLENLYQLLGVMDVGGSMAAVIVNKNQPPRGPAVKGRTADKRTYLPGDTLGGGYKLLKIESRSVKFVRDGREQELTMSQNKKGTVQAGSGSMPGMPPDPNMSRPPRPLRGGIMEGR